MDIDITALKSLVRERSLSLDVVVSAIEDALALAYQRVPGHAAQARVELDRSSGHVTVWAAELDEEGNQVGEFDDTPDGFGRVAAATARQVLLHRLQEALPEEGAPQQGSNIYWITRNDDDRLLSSGIYIWRVIMPERGDFWGKLVIIR